MGLGRSLYFSGMSSGLKLILQFGLSIFVARMLTPEELGSFGVALAAAAFVRAFESAGVNNFVASYSDLNTALMRSVFTINSLLNIALAIILFLAAEYVGVFYNSPLVTEILQLTAIATVLNTHIPLIQGLLRRDMRFKELMWLDLFLLVISGIVTVVAVIEGYGALSLAFAIISERITGLIVGLVFFRKNIPTLPGLKGAKAILKYGFTLSTANIIGIISTHSNNFILGKLLGIAPAAQFDRGYTLPRMISQVMQLSFHNVLVPEIAKQDREGRKFAPALKQTVRLYATIVWPTGTVLAIISPEIIMMLFGYNWAPAASISPYLIVYNVFASPVVLACSAFIALGHGQALVKNQLVDLASRVSVLTLAVFLDIYWLAALMLLPTLIYIFVATLQLKQFSIINPLELANSLIRPLGITLICILPAAAFRLAWGLDTYLTLQSLFAIVLFSIICFFVCLKTWENEALERMMEILKFKKV